LIRIAGLCLLAISVAGCAPQQPYADDTAIASVSYRDPGPKSLTLYTMINNRTGKGGHSSLMINASERVIFDPAGSFHADIVPERNDVLYGITPAVERAYRSSHARSTFHVDMQTIEVTPAQAETAYRLAVGNGRVAGGLCSSATANLLRQVPGFEHLNSSMFPTTLAEEFSRLPGVTSEKYYEDDSDDLQQGIATGNTQLNQVATEG
jgi:hypothetical protein